MGIDVVEMNPLADPGYTTALNVNRCIREMQMELGFSDAGHPDRRGTRSPHDRGSAMPAQARGPCARRARGGRT
jgi:hypothetical protein